MPFYKEAFGDEYALPNLMVDQFAADLRATMDNLSNSSAENFRKRWAEYIKPEHPRPMRQTIPQLEQLEYLKALSAALPAYIQEAKAIAEMEAALNERKAKALDEFLKIQNLIKSCTIKN